MRSAMPDKDAIWPWGEMAMASDSIALCVIDCGVLRKLPKKAGQGRGGQMSRKVLYRGHCFTCCYHGGLEWRGPS